MRVRALKQGYFTYLREKGDVFEIPDGTPLGKWMEPADGVPSQLPPPPKPVKAKQHTMANHAQVTATTSVRVGDARVI